MWFEILPAFTIIASSFGASACGMYAIHYFFLGTPYRRNLCYPFNRISYLRNRRLTDNPYLFNGLEVIPDEVKKTGGDGEGTSRLDKCLSIFEKK